MNKCILDSSALLALFNSENGSEKVEELLPLSIMSTVNIAEVVAELDKKLGIVPMCYISEDCIKYKELLLYGMEYIRKRLENENKVA